MFENVEFIVKHDQCKFTTTTNGDIIIITGINLGPDRAAALAYLVNQSENLKIEVKKETG